NDKEYFYRVRSLDPAALDDVQRASRMIFLNKTCFNGLYRVNRKGQFNVPFGRYANPKFCDPDNILAVSRGLQAAKLYVGPFESVLDRARRGDFVYFDPPYHPRSATANFTSYTEGAFGPLEQQRLLEAFSDLDRRGCLLMLSNSDTRLVKNLYRKFRRIPVSANRAINSVATKRGKIAELLILNY
ncbi:MAG: Dam family site-specific DNA-(adenine-N6)-methyltransferase, partial [Acidobacteria bacterium]|nr:Dam family site-specific DNA-(adenine-N6)-methyltransferase [Acidobacteriota bacterium]